MLAANPTKDFLCESFKIHHFYNLRKSPNAMSSTTTESRTSIELRSESSVQVEDPDWQTSTAARDTDTIVEASRIADASVPDGGYGWVIVAACSVVTFLFVGTTYSWGVIQDTLVEQKVAAASTLAFVGSLAVACNAAFAIVSGRLVRAFGARKVAILGISLMSLGQFLSGFSQTSIGGLFITAGLLMGCGVRYARAMSFSHHDQQLICLTAAVTWYARPTNFL
jgi:hypothetical protein